MFLARYLYDWLSVCMTKIESQWVDVEGFEGMYQINSEGELRSLRYRGSGRVHILKQTTSRGYKVVNLTKEGKQRVYRVHRLVAKAFLPNPENKPEVDHIDGDRSNNCLSNLRWVSGLENCNNPKTRCKLGKQMIGKTGEKHQRSKPLECVETGEKYSSAIDAAKATGIEYSNIAACCRGTRSTAGGYHWKYCFDNYKTSRWLNIDTGKTFDTLAEAADFAGVHLCSIYRAAISGHKSGGYNWKKISWEDCCV